MQLFNDRINKVRPLQIESFKVRTNNVVQGVVPVDKATLVKTVVKVCKGSADTAPVKQMECTLLDSPDLPRVNTPDYT